ncbi:MAG: YfiR family protein [Telluria sp.]
MRAIASRTAPVALPAWRRHLAHWLLACLAALCGVAATAPHAAVAQPAGAAPVPERRVKAAVLYKFLGYTDFPANAFADPAAPITMVVAGADDMAADLAALTAGRSVNGRPIAVRTLREGDGALAHLLFVAGADCARAGKVIRATRALLVVTECDSGLQQGAVINFRTVEEHVRFDVSLDAAERNNVRLSSRLLTVANHVQKGAP